MNKLLIPIIFTLHAVVFSQFPDAMVKASNKQLKDDLPRLVKYVEDDPGQVVMRGDLIVTVNQIISLLQNNDDDVDIGGLNHKIELLEQQAKLSSSSTPADLTNLIDNVLGEIEVRLPSIMASSATVTNLTQRVNQVEQSLSTDVQDYSDVDTGNLKGQIKYQTNEIRQLRNELKVYAQTKSTPTTIEGNSSFFQTMLFILVMAYGYLISF